MLKILALISFSMQVFLGYEAIKAKFLIPFNVLIFLFISTTDLVILTVF